MSWPQIKSLLCKLKDYMLTYISILKDNCLLETIKYPKLLEINLKAAHTLKCCYYVGTKKHADHACLSVINDVAFKTGESLGWQSGSSLAPASQAQDS
jgi:hypothetical protein